MKLFVADNKEIGGVDDNNYQWCEPNEMLMFGQFQKGNGNPSEISMCGIDSRKFTTNIVVKDLDISKEFLLELVTTSVEKSMNCKIDRNGDYSVKVGFDFDFNINDIINELIIKASEFDVDDSVSCFGRDLTIKNN